MSSEQYDTLSHALVIERAANEFDWNHVAGNTGAVELVVLSGVKLSSMSLGSVTCLLRLSLLVSKGKGGKCFGLASSVLLIGSA